MLNYANIVKKMIKYFNDIQASKLQPSKKLDFVKKKFYQTHKIVFFINVGYFYLSYFHF